MLHKQTIIAGVLPGLFNAENGDTPKSKGGNKPTALHSHQNPEQLEKTGSEGVKAGGINWTETGRELATKFVAAESKAEKQYGFVIAELRQVAKIGGNDGFDQLVAGMVDGLKKLRDQPGQRFTIKLAHKGGKEQTAYASESMSLNTRVAEVKNIRDFFKGAHPVCEALLGDPKTGYNTLRTMAANWKREMSKPRAKTGGESNETSIDKAQEAIGKASFAEALQCFHIALNAMDKQASKEATSYDRFFTDSMKQSAESTLAKWTQQNTQEQQAQEQIAA